jgi:thioesterase domain-containing protein
MSTQNTTAFAHLQSLLDRIPLTIAMQAKLTEYDGSQLAMSVPLAPNINDKGCAFGGSLASLMTITCWGLVELAARERGYDCDIYVGESTVKYLQPVWGDFQAEARLAGKGGWDIFFATLANRGRARAHIVAEVPGVDGKPAASLDARFVAKRRTIAA